MVEDENISLRKTDSEIVDKWTTVINNMFTTSDMVRLMI